MSRRSSLPCWPEWPTPQPFPNRLHAQAPPKAAAAAEASAMLERAVQALRADKQKALAAFTHGAKGFSQRDLYVFCFGQTESWMPIPTPQ